MKSSTALHNTIMSVITCGILALLTTPVVGQYLTPSPKKFDEKEKVSIYGLGSLSKLEDVATSSSADLRVVIHPTAFSSLFASFNKGAGLKEAKADSFAIQSLVFSEISNSAFYGNATIGRRFGGSKDLTSLSEIALFGDFALQNIKVLKGAQELKFDSRNYQLGVRYYWYYYKEENLRLRFIGDISYMWLNMSQRTLDNYKEAFNDPTLPKIFQGIGAQIGVQINDFTVAFKWRQIKKSDGKSISNLTGANYLLNFSVAGELFSF